MILWCFRVCCLTLFLAVCDIVSTFRLVHGPAAARRTPGCLRSDHIDEMMFECGIYSSNLRFPRNVDSELNPHSARDAATQTRLEEMSVELTTEQLENYQKRKEHIRIALPISGEVPWPSGGYLQELYCILEEHNRELLENELYKKGAANGDTSMDIDRLRKLVLPTQLYRIFDKPSSTKRFRLFPSTIKSDAPLVPGQVSTVTIPEVHRELLLDEIRSTNVFGIGVSFVDPPKSPNEAAEVSSHACMCEFVDITELDTTGRIIVRAVQRLSIEQMINSDEPLVLADVSLLEDERTPLRNPMVTHANARAIAKLYDRCNMEEAHLSRLTGRKEDAELVESREPFNEKLATMIRDIPVDGNHEYRILELTGFAALEFHADIETRMWAASKRDSEERLACAKTVLEEKSAYLKAKIAEASAPRKPLSTADFLETCS
ncbi:hypothetical protein BaOVIS_004310 [Babesia ovis]|uniref:Uncharacterized protein n=1 Tax=Babesia ovis TaxID=5869 RepID=A0A9W5TAR7_BABOV|nr:hypothetical protein BaOVIS_004310 [Babesia ovis]